MSSYTIASSVAGAHNTGQGTQTHEVYCTNSAEYVAVAFTSTQTLTCYYSTTGNSSWTAFGTTLTLANAHNSEGYNLSIAYANISSDDIIHISVSYQVSTTSHQTYHIRAVVSGTTITFSSELQVGSTNVNSSTLTDGNTTALDTNNKVYSNAAFYADGLSSVGNNDMQNFPNADTGSSWTQGSATLTGKTNLGGGCESHWLGSTGSGNMISISDNASTTGSPNNLQSNTWNGTTWSSNSNVFAASTSSKSNGWGAVVVGSNTHVVFQSSTATFTHRIWNGSSWGAGSSIPTLTFKSASGCPLVTDGTNIWLAAIASAAGNAVSYIKYNGSSWDAAWTTLESTSQTRQNIGICPQIQSSLISFYWTEGSSTFNIVGEQLNLAPAVVAGASTLALMGVG